MKELDPRWNDRMLEAWEEWKDICFVGGCSPESEKLLLGDEIEARGL